MASQIKSSTNGKARNARALLGPARPFPVHYRCITSAGRPRPFRLFSSDLARHASRVPNLLLTLHVRVALYVRPSLFLSRSEARVFYLISFYNRVGVV